MCETIKAPTCVSPLKKLIFEKFLLNSTLWMRIRMGMRMWPRMRMRLGMRMMIDK